MKTKLLSLIAGTMIVFAPVMGSIASAQTPMDLPALAGINLTPQQEEQLAKIRLQTQQQIQQILTEPQKAQFKVVTQQGKDLRQAIAAINLTAEQKAQVKQIFQAVRGEVTNTLTPEQQRQLKQNLRQQLMQRRSSF